MIDTTQPETTTPAPAPPPRKRTRSDVNQKSLAEIQAASEVLVVASKPQYAALADREITAEFLGALGKRIEEARASAGGVVVKTTTSGAVTETETVLKTALLKLLRQAQKAAKQKATRTKDKTLIKKYAVGEDVGKSRSALEQVASNFISMLPGDALPGISADEVEALKNALAAYQAVQGSQSGAQSTASSERVTLDSAVEEIKGMRREIQFAADAEWPAEDRANAPIRTEFKLHPTRAMK